MSALLVLDDLAEGPNALSFELRAEELKLKDEFFAFPSIIEVRVEVRRALGNFRIDGVITCRIAGECYRCLEEVQEGVSARFRLLLQRRQATPEELASAEQDGDRRSRDARGRFARVHPRIRYLGLADANTHPGRRWAVPALRS